MEINIDEEVVRTHYFTLDQEAMDTLEGILIIYKRDIQSRLPEPDSQAAYPRCILRG